MDIIDYDEIDDWAPELSAALSPYVTDSIKRKLKAAAPEYIEDAREVLFKLSSRDALIDATLTWIRSKNIAGYHGSRLTDAEMASIRESGLIPLKAEARRNRLERALSPHPEWSSVVDRLDVVIEDHGKGAAAGSREGKVYLTLSKFGLIHGFNHYLTHGSEFDQHVANKLLGKDGMELLAHDGSPRVIRVAVPGSLALEAAHSIFSIDDLRNRGDIPNIVSDFIEVWSYSVVDPEYKSRSLELDSGMEFNSIVPADWITHVDTLVE